MRSPGPALARRVALGAAVSFVLLAGAVAAGVLDGLDAGVRRVARPDEVWGPVQVNADIVVEGLRPAMLAGPAAAVTAAACLLRRSLRPMVMAAGTTLATVVLTLGVKLLLARPDPGGTSRNHGGSFPSGHTVSLVVAAGLAILLLSPRAPWWAWLAPAALGAAMAFSMVVQGAHWASDVLGGALLAAALLAAVCSTRAPDWAAGHPGIRAPARLPR